MEDERLGVVAVETLLDGFEQAFARWQAVERAPQDPAQTFIPLFEVLEWAACIDERLVDEQGSRLAWSPDLRGLRWARHRCRHDWSMVLEVRTRDELRLDPNVVRESMPAYEWAWRERLPEAKPVPKRLRGDEPLYRDHLAGQSARVTLNLVRGYFEEWRKIMRGPFPVETPGRK